MIELENRPVKLDLTDYARPSLESGEYLISSEQTLTIPDNERTRRIYPSVQKKFFVAGERFHLKPAEISGFFPPKYSSGDYASVLPHIILSRDTLPWERNANAAQKSPWLGLLLLHESEMSVEGINMVQTSNVALSNLQSNSTEDVVFPGLTLEPGQTGSDIVGVVDIRKELLENIIPSSQSLALCAHVRQNKDSSDGLLGDPASVIVSQRLPKAGEVSTAFLVSLENRYSDEGKFDFQGAAEVDYIRFVYLHKWEFTSLERFKITKGFVNHASNLPEGIKQKLLILDGEEYNSRELFLESLSLKAGLAPSELDAHRDTMVDDFAYGDFSGVLKHLDRETSTLRLPDVDNAKTNDYLKMGFYPLPHRLRNGSQTVSWYHGPLATKSNTEHVQFPVKASDALLRYYQQDGMFDVSYAAAWELGRMLALKDTNFSTKLSQWKTTYARGQHHERQHDEHGTRHLKNGNKRPGHVDLPESIGTWLEELCHLHGVPFNYLVPDEQLLPVESIRFFQLDNLWMRALVDGAFSIGRVTSGAHALDQEVAIHERMLTNDLTSGVILRSEAVSGWPGLQALGYMANSMGDVDHEQPIEGVLPMRMERLSKNVLLCLFRGDLQMLDLFLKADTLHFDLGDKSGKQEFAKTIKDPVNGRPTENTFSIKTENYAVPVEQLMNQIPQNDQGTDTPAGSSSLALQLLTGSKKVRFTR